MAVQPKSSIALSILTLMYQELTVLGGQLRFVSRPQKGRSPLIRFPCQKFVLSKIKRSRIIICKQNKHKACVLKARVPKTSLSKINIKHVLLRHVPLKKVCLSRVGEPRG